MTRRLSPQTTLDNLKKEAKRWLKALRSDDPDARARLDRSYPSAPIPAGLRDVQHALALEHGFSGWTDLKKALAAGAVEDADRAQMIHRFLEYACPDHHVRGRPAHAMARGAAMRMLQRNPEIATANLYTAIVCGELDEVARRLRESPNLTNAKSATDAADRIGAGHSDDLFHDIGPKNWEPLLYLCFTRLPLAKSTDNAVAMARLLLDSGANPNSFFMAGGSSYTPLAGVIGEGEEDRPPHPNRDELARLLLQRGAKPYDMQVVYNLLFHAKPLWFLKLIHEFSVKDGRQADWDDPEWSMLDMGGYGSGARWHLEIAVKNNDLELAEWCLSHGANPNAEGSLYELARRLGNIEMAELLASFGAPRIEVAINEEDEFVAFCLRANSGDIRVQAARWIARRPEFLQSSKAIFAAAKSNRSDVVRLLLDLGVPVEIEDEKRQRPLHIAASHDALEIAALLIERGAEIDPLEENWSNTPLDFAVYNDFPRMIELLAPHSRNPWNLVFTGHVARIREVLAEEPKLARSVWETTPLFSLPDDEAKALEIVELFVALGADAGFRRKDGATAADIARRRGLNEAADRLQAAADDKYARLANDLIAVYDSGDAGALERLNRHYDQSLTSDDVRAQVWRRVYAVRHAGGGKGSLDIGEARLFLARTAGLSNWTALLESASLGIPPSAAIYAINRKENRISPRRMLNAAEWDALIGKMQEMRITRLDANGFMTDEVLKRVARLDHVTHLDLGGSRELSDDGLQHLAGMPQLTHLDLSEYPGGKLTDRGLAVLRELPELRTFQMTWQSGITDAGAANLKFCEKLESVNLMGSPTGDGVIDALRGKPRLHRFDSGRLVTDDGLALLHDFSMFKSWHGEDPSREEPTHLLIDGPFTNRGLASLAGLDGVYALDLFWNVTGITTDAYEVFTQLPHLGYLGCDGKLSDDRAMVHIAAIPRLRKLRAQGSAATDDGFVALSRSASLETFWGREAPHLTGRGFVALSKMPSLKALGVSCKNVDGEALASLPQFPALRDLTPIDVEDAGFRHVGNCERLERLACMYCRETTDFATEHIRSLNLKTYYAGKTKITDRSLQMLGGMQSLERIEFWECAGITDAGLPYLAALPHLREVSISGSPNITLEGTAVFPAAVHVDYSP